MRSMLAATIVAITGMLTACDGMIYDEEGDCDPYYKVRFRYDWNMAFADAFPTQVLSVTLYVIDDATGKVVWQKHEAGDALRADGYMMDVDVAPGRYSLVAWCGEGHRSSYYVDDAELKTDLSCHIAVGGHTEASDPDTHHVKDDLNPLFHGKLDAQEFPDEQGVHVYTVPLKKNTNDIHVVLQQLSGEPVDASEFSFQITDNNAHMAWDNELYDPEPITYHAWWVQQGSADLEDDPDAITPPEKAPLPASRTLSSFSAAVADLTVGRLHKDSSTRLNVYKSNGERIISVPLIKYLLMVKGHYRNMDDQEFLDRKDDFPLTFFLDEGLRWTDSYIYIHSWKVHVQHTDL